MKQVIMSLIFLVSLSQSGFASGTADDQDTAAFQMKNALLPALKLSPHFSGIDITGCDSMTGAQSLADGNEPCVRIFLRSREAVTAARIIYPEGRRANETYIIVEYMNLIPR